MAQLKLLVAFLLVLGLMSLGFVAQPRFAVPGLGEVPLVLLLFLSAFLGALVTFLAGLAEFFSLKRRLKKAEAETERLKKERASLMAEKEKI